MFYYYCTSNKSTLIILSIYSTAFLIIMAEQILSGNCDLYKSKRYSDCVITPFSFPNTIKYSDIKAVFF